MEERQLELGQRGFTIGRVLAVAWRGFARHFVAITLTCLVAGTAGVLMPPTAQALYLSNSLAPWQWVISELLQVAIAIFIITPTLVLLLQVHAGRSVAFRNIIRWAGRRCGVLVATEIVFDAILVGPTLLFPASVDWRHQVALTIAFLIYAIPLLAINYTLLATLAAEPGGPIRAMNRVFKLASGHWLRLFVVAFILWLASWAIIAGVNFVTQLLFALLLWDWSLQQSVAASLGYGIRLLVVASVATAVYHLLRQEKDGRPAHEMARVFD